VVWLKGQSSHLFAGLMWSGAWSLTVTGPDAGGLAAMRVSLGAASTAIRTGKPFESPHGFFGVAGGEDADATAAIQAFARQDVRQGRPFSSLVTYNTWFAYGIRITEEALRAEMEQAAALGAEVFVVDAGWYPGGTQTADYSTGIGAWRVDARRFPSGLGALADHAHSLGMKFGIWIEPERVDTRYVNGAGAVRESWLAQAGGRYNSGMKNSSADAAQICLASAEARQWVVGQIERLVAEAHLDYLKWDNNYWINCDRSGHGHDAKDGNLAHVKGLYEVLATLRDRYPDLVIENCAEGGRRLDFGMLRYTDVAWMDDESAPSPHVRHNLEGLNAVFPSEYLLSFVIDHPSELIHGDVDMAYTFRSRMPGVLGMSLIGAEFDENDHRQMRDEIALSKRIRSSVPQPIPLLLTAQAAAAGGPAWDAIALVSGDSRNAVLLTFAGEGADGWATLRLQALQPDGRYVIRTFHGKRLAEASGAELMADGVQIPKRAAAAANVLLVELTDTPAPLRH
jgi:alpha-galactosidase